ncbi:MAG: hypothetical protein AB4352_29450 [Hormoscilla sp.]
MKIAKFDIKIAKHDDRMSSTDNWWAWNASPGVIGPGLLRGERLVDWLMN